VKPFHTTPEKFENATITGHFRFLSEENSEGSLVIIVTPSFSKGCVFKLFSMHTKQRKAGDFFLKFPRFEKRFRKAPFSNCFPCTLKRKASVFFLIPPV